MLILQVIESHNGNIKSIYFENSEGKRTVNVIEIGEYEFVVNTKIRIQILSGVLDVLRPDSLTWKMYQTGTSFKIDKGLKYKVKAHEMVAYLSI
jgi:purine/pyrimidine-nucleoside phosphorylase